MSERGTYGEGTSLSTVLVLFGLGVGAGYYWAGRRFIRSGATPRRGPDTSDIEEILVARGRDPYLYGLTSRTRGGSGG